MKVIRIILSSFVFILIIVISAQSQITNVEKALRYIVPDSLLGWKKSGIYSLNFSQATFNNWAAGGENSISVSSLFNLNFGFRSQKTSWDNFFALGYGMQQQGKSGKPIKTDDKIEFTSKYGKKAFKNFLYAGLVNFKSQFDAGYNYPNDSVRISDFLAPGYITAALGLDYKQGDKLSVFFAPLTGRITLVKSTTLADAGAFGVDPAVYDTTGELISHGKSIKKEFGGYIRIYLKKDLIKNVNLQMKLDLFSNYIKKPENLDVSWEVLISMKVNKFISATLSTQLLYDDDVIIKLDKNNDGIIDVNGPRTQFKEILAVGFSYKF